MIENEVGSGIDLAKIKRFYFIGIGGIGMSALARYFFAKGFEVAGYDKTPSDLTTLLIEEGMNIHFEDLGENIPVTYKDPSETLVVYTPAIPASMLELTFLKETHKVLKRSEVLGLVTQSSKGLGVAGTHGKTTTSSMLAYVLSQSNVKCSAFLGGISSNFNSNVYIDKEAEYSVIEADEFDRSFLRLSPFASIITAMDPDHLDIYGTVEEFEKGFQDYAKKNNSNGFVVAKYGLNLGEIACPVYSYGIEKNEAAVNGTNLRYAEGNFKMSVHFQASTWENVVLGLPGIHNAENALAVIQMCLLLGLTETEIRSGLANFKGVKRRFEYHVKATNFVYIDDYAHHPTEIEALVKSVRLLYPNKKVVGVFQPHLFSRTRDFLTGFIHELSQLDELILMDIYPAREVPIDGITSDLIAKEANCKASVKTSNEVFEYVNSMEECVFLTIGAGDIDRIVPKIKELILKRCES